MCWCGTVIVCFGMLRLLYVLVRYSDCMCWCGDCICWCDTVIVCVGVVQ